MILKCIGTHGSPMNNSRLDRMKLQTVMVKIILYFLQTALRNDLIRLPAIRCEFGKMNAKYEMYLRLGKLASPPGTPGYQFSVSQII